MENIKVSVLTPIYNHDIKYVTECLNSLKNQTMQEIEFLLIDNEAIREAKDLMSEYEKEDSRFRVLHIEKNEGYGRAINYGLKEAKGEYVGIVESDDWVESDMFEKLYNLAVENNVNIVRSAYYKEVIDGSNLFVNNIKSEHVNKKVNSREIFYCLLNHACPWSMLYKKEFLDKNDIKISKGKGNVAKDVGFVLKAFLSVDEIYSTDEPFYHYNVFNTNTSMKIDNTSYILNMLLNEYEDIYKWFEERVQKGISDKSDKGFIDKRLYYNVICNLKLRNFNKKQLNYVSKKILCKIDNTEKFSKEEVELIEEIKKNVKSYYKKTRADYTDIKPIENIFSVKNSKDKKHKCITLFGIHINLKRRKSRIERLIENLYLKIEKEKLSKKNLYYHLESMVLSNNIHKDTFAHYKNFHKDKEVVIIACGPTANYYNQLTDKVHIGINRAFLLKNVNLDYLFVQDYLSGDDCMTKANNYRKGSCEKFYGVIPDIRLKDVYPGIKRIPFSSVIEANAKQYVIGKMDFWPTDISFLPIRDFGGTAFSAMQFAIYTNPSKIYLVGCDCTNGEHFYKDNAEAYSNKFDDLYNIWVNIKEYLKENYPDTEVISVNPVGLKGLFKDVYTQSYIDEHPELLDEVPEIIDMQIKI